MTILPKSKLGKWSFTLIVVFILMLLLFFVMINVFDQRGGDTFFSNPLLTVPMLFGFACAAAGFVTGFISFFAAKERSLLVYLSVLIGLLVIVYGVMELAFPH